VPRVGEVAAGTGIAQGYAGQVGGRVAGVEQLDEVMGIDAAAVAAAAVDLADDHLRHARVGGIAGGGHGGGIARARRLQGEIRAVVAGVGAAAVIAHGGRAVAQRAGRVGGAVGGAVADQVENFRAGRTDVVGNLAGAG